MLSHPLLPRRLGNGHEKHCRWHKMASTRIQSSQHAVVGSAIARNLPSVEQSSTLDPSPKHTVDAHAIMPALHQDDISMS